MTTKKLSLAKIMFLLLASAAMLFGAAPQADAQAVTMILTINGGSSVQIVNGQSVTLAWYIDGPVTNCSINNGVGNIDVSTLPATGTMMYTPPANSSTNFVLNCDGTTSSVTAAIAPQVTMTLPQGTTRTTNPLTGSVDRVEVAWDAPLATRCSDVWSQSAIRGTYVAANSNEYSNKNQRSGWVRFEGWPHGNISEDTTFYITCYNDTNGTSATGSVSVTILNPAPPADPVLNLWTNTPLTSIDPTFGGYATADVRFDAFNVTWCSYGAYYASDGSPYASLPNGWGYSWGGHTSAAYNNILIATSTIFEVTCDRGAVTIGGVTYPATSTTATVQVNVIQGSTTIDRLTLPPVSISATATPSTVIRDPIWNRGTTTVDLTVANADWCYLRAFKISDGSEYDLSNWTRTSLHDRLNGNNTYSFYLWSITVDTRLNIECLRQYDEDFYNPGDPEYENGYETLDVVIIATSSPVAAAAPDARVYGNAWSPSADVINSIATNISNWTYNGDWLEGPAGVSYSEVTFPFDHPFDSTDTYDIYLKYCDENDGTQNTFSVSVNGGPVLGTIVTDDPTSAEPTCASEGTDMVKRIAVGVSLTEGDSVTIGCQNDQVNVGGTGEWCRLLRVYFGAGSGDGSTLAAVTSTTTGFAGIPLFWYTERSTHCSPGTNVSPAYPIDSPSLRYEWHPGSWRTISTVIDYISTSTQYINHCYRKADSLNDTGSVAISLPGSFTLTASTSVAAGQCIDPVTLTTITAPPGYMPDPVTGFCVAAVDLAAFSPSPGAGATPDPVFGTYDNFNANLLIENLGPGPLPQGSGVTYLATIDPHPAHGLPQFVSPTGYYNATITAPAVMPGSTLSSGLTRTFNGVPFGTHQLCSRVNLDGAPNFPEHNSDTTNNSNCTNFFLAVPPPPMTLTPDRTIIRPEQTVDLTWFINIAYEMNCTVNGPGGISAAFNTLATGYPYSVTQTTGPLTSTSEFTFTCNEPITNTTFTEKAVVEVIPESQEI